MDELALRQLNGGEDEDEALRRALALSMGEAGDAQVTWTHQVSVDCHDCLSSLNSLSSLSSLVGASFAGVSLASSYQR
ncbi:hypothetical protein SCUCBS95973_001887 [Sporothrix curviconia]|uniref:Uncharacterized protein n=1 Tax=Sporothrix curviconia TaxID=1260050 RepID=A0ABP0B2E5_9PEZI